MRLASIAGPDGPRLIATLDERRGLDISLAAKRLGLEALADLGDVGALLQRGERTVAEARALATTTGRWPDDAVVDLVDARFLPPVAGPPKILCIAMNYVQHAEEGPEDLPDVPLIFAKFGNALTGHDAPVAIPSMTRQVDWEGELAFVVGRRAKAVSREEALSHVAGYTIINDITARDVQFGDGQWTRGKSFDGFAPLGPWFVTPDETGDPAMLQLQTRVNGELRQDVRCGEMVHDIASIVSYVSHGITLEPGDVVATGTPAGCALGWEHPVYLAPGDVMEVSITGLGVLRTPMIAA